MKIQVLERFRNDAANAAARYKSPIAHIYRSALLTRGDFTEQPNVKNKRRFSIELMHYEQQVLHGHKPLIIHQFAKARTY